MSLLAAFSVGQWIIGILMLAVCALLILIVLVQQASGGGLVGAFGGGGGGGAFGAKTGDVFTVITVVLAGVYLVLAVIGNYVFRPVGVPLASSAIVANQPAPMTPAPINLPIGDLPSQSITIPVGQKVPVTIDDSGALVPVDTVPAGSDSVTGQPASSQPTPATEEQESPQGDPSTKPGSEETP